MFKYVWKDKSEKVEKLLDFMSKIGMQIVLTHISVKVNVFIS